MLKVLKSYLTDVKFEVSLKMIMLFLGFIWITTSGDYRMFCTMSLLLDVVT